MRRDLPWMIAALAIIAALVGGVAWLTSRDAPAPAREDPTNRTRRLARDELQSLAEDSARLMPEGINRVWLGMGTELLRRARPRARVAEGAPEGTTLYEETLENGARAVWFVSSRLGVLTKAQFLSRLEGVAALRGHFDALRARYGEPTGFWDCPGADDRAPLRRITWRGVRASVMEAILVYRGGVSVTLVVSPSSDVAGALAQSRCAPVTRETLGQWPIAEELRGRRIPWTDMR